MLLVPEVIQRYKTAIEVFGPDDYVAMVEVSPEAVEFKASVWWVLDYCDNENIKVACRIAEALVDLKDHYVGSSYSGYNLENMFTFLAMKEELEAMERLFLEVKE